MTRIYALFRTPDPLTLETRLLDVLTEAGYAQKLSWQEIECIIDQLHNNPPAPRGRPHSAQSFRRSFGLPPAWHDGANSYEVLAFGIYPDRPGNGAGIPLLTDDELARQMTLAEVRLQHQSTPWLRRYAGALADESDVREYR